MLAISCCIIIAKLDYKSKITNPGYEPENTTSWTYTGAVGYYWLWPIPMRIQSNRALNKRF